MGLAIDALQWSASPWFVSAKQWVAQFLVGAGVTWPLETTAPWWILTDYPLRNDVLTLLDGILLVVYVVAAALVFSMTTMLMIGLATHFLGGWSMARFHHLAQALIPLAGSGVFLGLSALTVSQLRSDGIILPFVGEMRTAMLALATLWSAALCWKIAVLYTPARSRRIASLIAFCMAMAPANVGWLLLFRLW
jgi:hypothetical protein